MAGFEVWVLTKRGASLFQQHAGRSILYGLTSTCKYAPIDLLGRYTCTLTPAWVECCFLTKVVLFFNIRIHVHSYACVCIHMHFIVFRMHSDALHSTIRLHSNAF